MTRSQALTLAAIPILALTLTACSPTGNAQPAPSATPSLLAELPAADRDKAAADLVRSELNLADTAPEADIVDFLHQTCDLMDSYDGDTVGYTAASIKLMQAAGYTASQAPIVNVTAASAYCPQHMDLADIGN